MRNPGIPHFIAILRGKIRIDPEVFRVGTVEKITICRLLLYEYAHFTKAGASISFDLGFRLHFVLCTNLQVHGVLLTNILGHQGVNLTPRHRWKQPSSLHSRTEETVVLTQFKRCKSLQVNSKQHVKRIAVRGSLFQDCAAGRS